MKRKALWAALAAVAILGLWALSRTAVGPGEQGGQERQAGQEGSGRGAEGSSARGARPDRLEAVAPGSTPPIDDAPALEGGAFSFTVVARGVPVPGAAVRLYQRGRVDPNTAQTEWKLAGAGKTGAEGQVQLAARAGSYFVAARAPGFAPSQREVKKPQGAKVVRETLELSAGLSVSGRTVSKGEAVPLAWVALSRVEGRAAAFGSSLRADVPPEEQLRVASDERGRFTAAGLSPGSWQAEARATGYGRGLSSLTVPRQGELVLELPAASFVEGRVLLADGAAAPGAQVTAVGGDEPQTATAQAGGAFSLEVEPGRWTVSARRDALAGNAREPVYVAAGQTARGLEVRLGQGGVIEGKVTREKGGAAVAGAKVDVSPRGLSGDSGRAVSGPDGSYRVEGLSAGAYDVQAGAAGLRDAIKTGITLTPGQRFAVDFALKGTGSVEGLVTDSRGAAVEGARVASGRSFMGGGGTVSEARTGPDGRYQLSGLPAGRVTLIATRDGSAMGATGAADVTEESSATLDFTLQDDGVITGTVTRQGGLPAGVLVFVMWAQPAVNMGDYATAPVDESGAYRLQVPPGSYRLGTRVGGRQQLPGGPAAPTVRVEAAATVVQDLTLPAEEGEQAHLVIRVLEPGGAPSRGASVQVRSTQPGVSFRMYLPADASGKAELTRPAGDLPLTLEAEASNGGRSGKAQGSREQPELVVQLQPGARLEGKVTGLDPSVSYTVSVALEADEQGFSEVQQTFLGEQFLFDDVPAGALRIQVRSQDGRIGSAKAQAVSGQTAQVQLDLSAGSKVSGRLVDDQGKPVADAWIQLDGNLSLRSGGDGRFSTEALGAGEHKLSAFLPPLRVLKERPFTVPAGGQPVDLGDLVLPPLKAKPGEVGVSLRGDSAGVLVIFVYPGSPAEQAGLVAGDQLTDIDGQRVTNTADAIGGLRGAPGSSVVVRFLRAGNQRVVTIVRAS
jgi:Carboxypeptidase regulatory-like domain/PDZ domain